MQSAKQAYSNHKARAKRKGIDFYFTFEEWVAWWETQLGPNWLTKRGNMPWHFCMARFKDRGPYHPSNVECITMKQNQEDQLANGRVNGGELNGTSRLTEKEVIEIFHMKGSYHDIAAKYGTTRSRVYRIKSGRVWKHITRPLLGLPVREYYEYDYWKYR